MIDGLPTVSSGVCDQSVAGLGQTLPAREIAGREYQSTDEIPIVKLQMFHRSDMLSGDQQSVFWGLRVQIPKSQEILVLMEHGGRDFPTGNPAEDAGLM